MPKPCALSRVGTPAHSTSAYLTHARIRFVPGWLWRGGGIGWPTVALAPILVKPMRHNASALFRDRKSTRLNSSHLVISYAVFCLKKKKKTSNVTSLRNLRSPLPVTFNRGQDKAPDLRRLLSRHRACLAETLRAQPPPPASRPLPS